MCEGANLNKNLLWPGTLDVLGYLCLWGDQLIRL